MRISTGYQFESLTDHVAVSHSRLMEAQRQISSGKKLHAPSDDPVGTRILLNYRSLQAGMRQYTENLSMAKGFLSFSEEALGEASGILRKGYELAVRGANASMDQSGRNAMADEVTHLQQRLVEVANTRGTSGGYVFAGHRTDTKPFTVSGSTLVYSGDYGQIHVEISPSETLPMNSLMGTEFVAAYQALEDLKARLQGGDVGGLSGVSIPDLQAHQTTLQYERGRVGTKLLTVQETTASYARRDEEFATRISDIEDVDLSEAIVDYKKAETAYHAALQVASQGFGLSLMDFIRG